MKPLLFGKYCLLERVSVGGMAEVFRAKPFDEPDFGGYLALKRILPHLAEDNEFIKMFVDEAKLTVQLQHPNIVRIYELGQFQKSYYILMEFISGKDLLALQKKMRRTRNILPVDMSMYIAAEMCRGLHFAHHKRDPDGNPLNIIHRDVSPQNVLVDYRGRVKVIDFGIAKAAVQSTRTQIGVLKGKMGYMSPEQVRGEVLDYRSDVFAIGTVLWEMLTNRRLFHAENEFETMQRVQNATAAPPSSRNPLVTPEVDALVMRALTADPEDRYESAEEFANAIDAWLEENPFSGEDLSVWMRTVFADDLDEERAKRDSFAGIVTPEDVLQLQNEGLEPAPEIPVEPVGLSEESAAADQVWGREDAPEAPDVEVDSGWAGEAPSEGEDISEFADAHTTVTAGGFNPDEAADAGAIDDIAPVGVPDPGPTMPDPEPQPAVTGPVGYAAISEAEHAPPAKQATASEFKSEKTNPGAQAPPEEEGPPKIFLVVGILSVLLLLGGIAAALAAVMTEPEPPPVTTGSVTWTIEPAADLQVKLDGQLVGTTSPHTVENIAAGEHVLSVSHEAYEPAEQPLTVAAGQTASVSITLEPKELGPGFVALRFPSELEDVVVFVDGEKKEVTGKEASFELPSGQHLLEATRPGFKPWSTVMTVEPKVRSEEVVRFEESGVDFKVVAGASSSVRVGKERLGRGTVTAEKLSPSEIHKVSVTYRGQGVSSWSSHVGLPDLMAGIEVDFDKPTPPTRRERDFGFLQVSTGDDWWNVLIDGHPTHLTTPIDVREKLPIVPGKHTLTLERGGVKKDFEVEILKGETFIWRQNVSFEWKPAE